VLPQAGSNVPEVSMNPYLRANYLSKVIDFDKAVTTGRTGLGANLIAGDMFDTLHPNNAGYAVLYAEEQADVPFV
jgi:lysophospholipase L1-like esterase